MKKNLKRISWIVFIILFIFFALGWFYFPVIHNFYLLSILILVLISILGYLWSKNLEIGFYIFVASLFFTRFPTLEIFNFSLNLSFIFGLGLILGFLIDFFRNKKLKINFKPKIIYWSLIAFWLINLVSLIINQINFRSLAVFLLISFCLILFILVSNFNFSNKVLQKISLILIWGGFAVCLFAFYQYFGDLLGIPPKFTLLRLNYTAQIFGFPRVQSTFLEPLLFANFLLIPIFVLTSLWLKNQIKNYIFVLIAPIYLIVFILTISRGAYIALISGIIFLIIFLWRSFTKEKIIGSILVTVASIAIALTMIGSVSSEALANFFSHNAELAKKPSEQGFSTAHRLTTFELGFQAFKEKPIFGLGPSNYGEYFNEHIKEEVLKNRYQTVANEYIELLAENGILGLVSFLIFLFSLFYFGIKSYLKQKENIKKFLLIAFLGALLAIFVQYNFFSTIYVIYIWFSAAIILALAKNLIYYEPK